MEPFINQGATGTRSPKEAAARTGVVLTCLMDDKSVLDSVTGENGVLAGLKPGGVHIGTTTISPGCAAQLAELHAAHGSYYVAGPVVGRPHHAETGQLLTYVAGDPEVIAKCTHLFNAYTRGTTNVGPEHKVANSVKLSINYMAISLIEMMGQVYAFGEKSEIDSELVNELIEMILDHPVLRMYAKKIRTRDFDGAGFELVSGFKDVQLMLEASTDTRAPLNYASIIREKLLTAMAHGMEYRDWSAIYEITRMNAGLE